MRVSIPLLLGVCLVVVTVAFGQAPAPTEDRVGFPDNYQSMNLLYVFDRPDNKQLRTVYSNDAAFSVQFGQQGAYPYGSVIVMETWRAMQDAQGNPILDVNGRFQKDPAAGPTLFVMRKERGFGTAYLDNRNGEWEYVAYRPDGTYNTPPQNSASCAICHKQAGQGKDWVFRAALHFNNGSGAVPGGVFKNYRFVPSEMHMKAGSTLTIYNDDVIAHTITDDTPGGGDTGPIAAGKSVTLKIDFPGEYDFHCSIHNFKEKIIVEP
jgi:plastocyanin